MSSFSSALNHFHFLRPEWLWALLLLPAAFLIVQRTSGESKDWSAHVDPALRKYVLDEKLAVNLRTPLALLALVGLLSILALAGPVWQRLPAPVFRNLSPLVIVLDLSSKMDVQDLKPSRLERARFKIDDLLRARRDGQTALLVYSDDAFVVSPLTDDVQTIQAQLNALSPGIMPGQGEKLSRALTQAVSLLLQAGQSHGDILIVTAGAVDEGAMEAITTLKTMGYRISIEGVGTLEGAPIPLPGGGFKKSSAGGLEMARLDLKGLWSMAQAGGGIYRTLDDEGHRDIEAILEFLDRKPEVTDNAGDPVEIHQWRESGVFLLPVILVLAALLFRKGWLFSFFLLLCLPLQSPPKADEGPGSLWLTPDQAGSRAFKQGQYESAKETFQNPDWKAAAAYKAGDYGSALKALEDSKEGARDYNRGNALAMQGQYAEALKAYDAQLEKTPGDEDTIYNRKLVEDALKKQQDQPKKPEDDKKSENDGDKNQKKDPKQDPQGKDQDKNKKDPQKDSGNPDKNQGQNPKDDPDSKSPPKDSKDQGQKPPPSNDPSHPKDSDAKPPEGKNQDPSDNQPKDPPPSPKGSDGKDAPEAPPEKPKEAGNPGDKPPPDELDQSSAQWLRRIPDDPGGLLRRKFLYQSQQRQKQR
jgi:Ca-activated chloride channel homolog